jgi:uncharacterized protein YbjT (DUF2867 family)
MVGCNSENKETDPQSQKKNTQGALILVTGITGNQGGGVANTLLDEGLNVRGMTRNTSSESAQYWARRGAEMVYGDFTNRESIDVVLNDVEYIFINLQEQVPDYINATKYLLDAANAAGVKHIIYSSSRSSDPDVAGGGHKTEIEIYLRESGYSYTTLRIPQQMSSVTRDMTELLTVGWRGRGSETKPFAWISPDDLGPITLAAIENPKVWNGREVNLSGDELTDLELVSILRELSGLDIKYTPPPVNDERWGAAQNLSYDTEQLRAEFPMTTFREYLIKNNFGENLRAIASQQ